MSTVQNEPGLPTRGAPFFIPTPDVEQHWPAVEYMLKQAEVWTQVVSASEILEYLKDGRAQAWGVVDQADLLSFAITRCTDGARGRLCTAWIFIPLSAQDDASISALLENVEAYGRSRNASVLEIFTAPWLSQRVNSHLARAKVTAVVLELDLRLPRSTN